MKQSLLFTGALAMMLCFTGCEIEDVTEDVEEENTEVEDSMSLNMTETDMYVGQDPVQLTATVTTSKADKTVSWESSNPSIATVSSTGLVSPKSNGITIITAKWNEKAVKCTVGVSNCQVQIMSHLEIFQTNSYTIPSYITPITKSPPKITWSSSNSSIAALDESYGLVKGMNPGEATVSATLFNGAKADCKVTVLPCELIDAENTLIPGNIATEGDMQYFKFYATGGTQYTVTIEDTKTSGSYTGWMMCAITADDQRKTWLTTEKTHTSGALTETFNVPYSKFVYIAVAGFYETTGTFGIKITH